MAERMYQGETELWDAKSRLANLAELLTAIAHQKKGLERNAYIEAASHVRVAATELTDAHKEMAREELNCA